MSPGARCRERLDQLAKPPGSLGRLEALAVQMAETQGRMPPTCDRPAVLIAAGDHGIAAHGVSAYPSAVTGLMCAAFAQGHAAISVLATLAGAPVEVLDVGVAGPTPLGATPAKVCAGAADSTLVPAMSAGECAAALAAGERAAERLAAAGHDALALGEMGIGNTTAAALVGCALLGLPPAALAGPGTGLDPAGVARKRSVMANALARHARDAGDAAGTPTIALAGLGGLELAALAGAMLAAPRLRLPMVVDGFIATAAALVACRIDPLVRPCLIFAHRSAEPGHAHLLAALAAEPLLALDLRLGEASGAALALPLLRAACAIPAGMRTLAELGIAPAAAGGR